MTNPYPPYSTSDDPNTYCPSPLDEAAITRFLAPHPSVVFVLSQGCRRNFEWSPTICVAASHGRAVLDAVEAMCDPGWLFRIDRVLRLGSNVPRSHGTLAAVFGRAGVASVYELEFFVPNYLLDSPSSRRMERFALSQERIFRRR